MIVRSEYSFREVFGPVKEVVARLPPWGGIIADAGCWGHVPFAQECARADKRAVLGARFDVGGFPLIIVPRTPRGLRELYGVIAAGAAPAERLGDLAGDWCGVVYGMAGHVPGATRAFAPGWGAAPGAPYTTPDNLFPAPGDTRAWQLMLGRAARARAAPGHILTEHELRLEGATEAQLLGMRQLVAACDTPVPRAENVKFPVPDPMRELKAICEAELMRRGLGPEYAARLKYELELVAAKGFADYFLVIWDMIRYAKTKMLVGPARGSSAGSLMCWLTRITEIDPLRHGLIFERFIDVNRMDLPDIDIDFPDSERHLVLEYLRAKYGAQNVANIGTIIRYKPKSALIDVAKHGEVPLSELDALKDVMIERSSGDSRISLCLADSFANMEVGRKLLTKYPLLESATRLENHARSAGVHAAGWIVCNAPVSNYCAVTPERVAEIDKKTAEALNILKIDALGLRTLSVIEECCRIAGIDRETLYGIPLDDPAVFALLNARKFSGIFQYEGIALQSVAKQITIDCFDDVAAITALARPGPLSGGETTRWVLGKSTKKWAAMHPALEPYTRETYGTIIYQETVMRVCRELGQFSWADTAKIRKLMSARQGNEAFAKWGEQFVAGAQKNGVDLDNANKIWKAIDTMGSWAFNKSHAVAYGLLSYWTAWLKAYHPLPFAVANLRHARDEEGALAMLRELHREYPDLRFTPCDPVRSTARWEYAEGELLGPLTGLPGLGEKTAADIEARRINGDPLTARHKRLLAGESRFKDHSPAHRLWGDWYEHPEKHFKTTRQVHDIAAIDDSLKAQKWVVIGRLIKKNLRDLNEEKYLVRRGRDKIKRDADRYMLLFHLEDDTGRLLCCINAARYRELGVPIVERAAIGQWFAVRGSIPTDFKMLQVDNVMWLEETHG